MLDDSEQKTVTYKEIWKERIDEGKKENEKLIKEAEQRMEAAKKRMEAAKKRMEAANYQVNIANELEGKAQNPKNKAIITYLNNAKTAAEEASKSMEVAKRVYAMENYISSYRRIIDNQLKEIHNRLNSLEGEEKLDNEQDIADLKKGIEILKGEDKENEVIVEGLLGEDGLSDKKRVEGARAQEEGSFDSEKRILQKQVELSREDEKTFKSIDSLQHEFITKLDALIYAREVNKSEVNKSDVERAEREFQDICGKLAAKEQKAADSAHCNAIYKLQNSMKELNLANNELNKFYEEDLATKVNRAISHGKAYLYAFPRVGRMIIGSMFWPMTKLERLRGEKDGKCYFEYDTTRANIVIDCFTRNHQLESNKQYPRTLADGFIDLNDEIQIKLVFPDAKATDRSEARIYVRKKDTNGNWKEEERPPIDLVTVRDGIYIKKYFDKEGKVQVDIQYMHDTMPDVQNKAKEDIEKLRKAAEGGFRPEQVAGMYVFNPETNTYNTPNWREFDLGDQNFNSIKWVDGILVWRHEGPTRWGLNISMEMLG